MNELTDDSPCPVNGDHLGKPMVKVPSSYLDWLSGQEWLERKYPEVREYIRRSRKAIDQDLEREGR